MMRATTVWLLALLCACSSESETVEPESQVGPESLELDFHLASVPMGSRVAISSFIGPALVAVESESVCAEVAVDQLRLIQVHREGVFAADESILELEDGVTRVPLESARSILDAALVPRVASGLTWAAQGCGSALHEVQSRRMLMAIEAGMPLSTVQLVLQSLQKAGVYELVFLVDSNESLDAEDWLTDHRPPVLFGPGEVWDANAVGGHAVVELGDASWTEAVRLHSSLAALGAGCVSYAWGSGSGETRLKESSEPQTIGSGGRVPVLALGPLQLSLGTDVSGLDSELVTGARCGDWGRIGPSGSRPEGGS